MKKVKRRIFVVLTAFLCLVLLLTVSFNCLFPIVNARALQYSRSYATEVINSAVKTVFSENQYPSVVKAETDDDGNVISLSCDTALLNRIKSDVSLKIIEMLSDEGRRVLYVPIGNLTGMYLLSGKGIRLSVRLIPTDSVLSEAVSSFSEVGINQSWHRILLKLTVRLGVIVLGKHNIVDVGDSIVVADTVIVGRVPEAYTDIEKADDDTIGEIVDFKAG